MTNHSSAPTVPSRKATNTRRCFTTTTGGRDKNVVSMATTSLAPIQIIFFLHRFLRLVVFNQMTAFTWNFFAVRYDETQALNMPFMFNGKRCRNFVHESYW
ncbi:hypothetical protein ES288_A04G152600v1 [Gossypium darwinii]|uniref:Uncharacterized protein n=2 Tax=Gossypium TaxID=3633 RepID=A0A5D2QYI4_GOSTO|nr:hypothetical protein ES288_A04G152600v1 [Gossypium darwinii]TYI33697.1 hypothetical protein ES332_A04G151900v1 [Gossypium tomentosum]